MPSIWSADRVAAAAKAAALPLSRDRRSGVNSVIVVSSLMIGRWPANAFSNQRLRVRKSLLNRHGKPRPGTDDVIICAAHDQCAVHDSAEHNRCDTLAR